jgi:hypothetical protein
VVGLPAGLAELREQGLIANIGLSNVTIDQFHAARAIVGIAAVTAHYNPAVNAHVSGRGGVAGHPAMTTAIGGGCISPRYGS